MNGSLIRKKTDELSANILPDLALISEPAKIKVMINKGKGGLGGE
jgi:archaellum component FlaG (FlaF/FlaG flagellin family)